MCLCVVWVLDVQIFVLTLREYLYSAMRCGGVCYDSVEGRGVKGERGGEGREQVLHGREGRHE